MNSCSSPLSTCSKMIVSAARGEMAIRGLGVFEHESQLGNAPAHQLFDLLIEIHGPEAPRSFREYSVTKDSARAPGIALPLGYRAYTDLFDEDELLPLSGLRPSVLRAPVGAG